MTFIFPCTIRLKQNWGLRNFRVWTRCEQYICGISGGCSPYEKKNRKATQTVFDNTVSWERQEAIIRNFSQDAFFISSKGIEKNGIRMTMGVFDGVGGWDQHGINVRDFSWGISQKAKEICENEMNNNLSPSKILQKAYESVQNDDQFVAGGTTACLGQFCCEKGNFYLTNLGDSGCSIYRNGTLFFASKAQTHFFNAPFQLSKIPQHLLQKNKEKGTSYLKNQVSDADEYSHCLKHGDLVVFATDGLLDNLFFKNIETIVTETLVDAGIWLKFKGNIKPSTDNITKDQILSAMKVSQHLVSSAKQIAYYTKIDTPFSQEARKHRFFYRGGKPDDTVALTLLVLNATYVTTLPPPILFHL
ncbi:hypothetical protein PCANB_000072 [Pneumocystis canis]|nr:hypothetical protein PCK1_000207 [Pneumocystis canis]KAG5439790.1 hypothetical protein PCANB_000072 [Pneumocystis canis]